MIRLDADRCVHFCDGLTRRDFLHAGTIGVLGLTLSDLFRLKAYGAVNEDSDVNVIMPFLVGAPSQRDTWDMKPDAARADAVPHGRVETNSFLPTDQASEPILLKIVPKRTAARR